MVFFLKYSFDIIICMKKAGAAGCNVIGRHGFSDSYINLTCPNASKDKLNVIMSYFLSNMGLVDCRLVKIEYKSATPTLRNLFGHPWVEFSIKGYPDRLNYCLTSSDPGMFNSFEIEYTDSGVKNK